MKVLAIHTQHNATCAFMDNGNIECVVSEEKFSNIKNDSSFPKQSILYIKKSYNVDCFDYVIICAEQCKIDLHGGRNPDVSIEPNFFKSFYEQLVLNAHRLGFGWAYRLAQKCKFQITKPQRQRKITRYLRSLDFLEFGDLLFYDHHDCHAFAAYGALRGSEKEALVFTADGQGDLSAARVYLANKKGLKRIANTYWTHSVGELYGKVTQLLGMRQLEHEYKVMGLAPYVANKNYYRETKNTLFDGLIKVREDLTFEARFPMNLSARVLAAKMPFHRFDNLAAALQDFTEEVVVEWVSKAITKTGINTIYTGGGLFMNVKVNKRLQEMDEVRVAKFMPSSGDESLPIGACYKFYFETMGMFCKPLHNIYLGPAYSNKAIESFINQSGLADRYKIEFVDDVEYHIAQRLADGEVVARFKGAAEWGARSLGNRAILARPDRMESFFMVNDQVKMRDFWMPFAPSILRETHKTYLKMGKVTMAPFMITSFDSTDRGRRDFCAAMHNRDKTLRAQIVDESVNPSYHKLLSHFHDLTGIGGVLNTSFNLHGYPLVCSPQQAILTIDSCDLRCLALENYFLVKRAQSVS